MLRHDCYLVRNTPAAPAIARRHVGEALSDSPRDVVDVVALMVSELATNCVLYAGTDFTISIDQSTDGVHVAVADQDRGRPALQRPAPDELTGRGLHIVDQLSDEWGVSPIDGNGKSVWFTLRSR